MSDDYKVIKTWIKEAEFEVLVLVIPKDEVEDKLAYLARDKGNINKSFYEDFVIATCVANINQLLYHIRQSVNPPNLMEVRKEIMTKILEINSLLLPENLVINQNSVIKLKGKDGLKDNERPLVENKNWNLTYYDGTDGASEENLTEIDSDPVVEETKKNKRVPSEMKKIDDLSFEVIQQWWRRINKYIDIKKFNEGDIESILSQRFFHNKSSFETYIVSICVLNSEDLFILLDNMGVPSNIAPPILMHELYELCRDINDFLTYEKARDLFEDSGDNQKEQQPSAGKGRTPNRMSSHVQQQQTNKKKAKKKFKDVPKEDLLKLSDAMKVFVIGQDEAINQVVETVQRASVGLKDPVKPIGSFLFAGRTGVGKSETCKVLANELIKDRDNLITIDCSEYSADHEYSKLLGSPPGYIAYEQGGILTNAVTENPFSVVVFDEVEKASNKVHELMLQILDEGRLTDNKGNKVSFKDTIIIMTSNIGVSEVEEVKKTIGFGDVSILTEDKKTKAIDSAIKQKFKPEFINRIDSIVHFRSLEKDDYMRIIDIELYRLNDNLRTNDTEFKNLTLDFDKKVRSFVYKHGIDPDFGARPLKRCIEKEVSTPLASRLLRGDINNSDKVVVTVKNGKIDFNIKGAKPKEKSVELTTCKY